MLANAAKLPLTNIYVDYELKNEKIALVNPELLLPERRAIKLVNITGDHGIKIIKNIGNPLNYPRY
jgi:hypothetical protein